MSLEQLQHERVVLGPLIRDVIAKKQARILDISSEIERRTADNG
jgi:hypothetical protein